MKKIKFFGIIILVGLLFNGCDDLVEVTPKSVLTAAVVWQDEGDAHSGMNGVLNQFRSTFNWNGGFWFELRSGLWDFGHLGEDAGTPGWQTVFDNNLDPSASPGTNWASIYTTINGANLAIKYLPLIDFARESTRNRLLAKAYFVRAYSYFALARIYGDVPIVLDGFESIDAADLFPVRRPVAEVFTQIKIDLDKATEMFPADAPISRTRPTKAAINMLRADVYLWTAKRLDGGAGDLTIANTAVDAVLANTNYQLLEDYENIFRAETTDETIFCLYFARDEANHNFTNAVWSLTDVPSEYHNNPVIVGGNNRITFTDSYIELLDRVSGDIRRDVNFSEFTTPDGTYFYWVNKYIGELVDGTRFFTSNRQIYRYAEAVLFKAEVLNAQGQKDQAIGYLNQIARRAYGVDDFYSTTLSQAEVDEAILDERLIEFGAEGKSWFDIIRFGKAFERIPSLVGREGDKQGNVLLFPLAPVTISRNPNIVQTPGY